MALLCIPAQGADAPITLVIRSVVACDVAARMQYAGRDLATAAREVIHEKLPKLGGKGGLIAVDAAGNRLIPA